MDMKYPPLFSVVVIAKNEASTLPRLLDSLKEFQQRGGTVVVLDTGSTDRTVEIARARGCKVTETTFTQQLGDAEAKVLNGQFVVYPEEPIVKAGDRYFDFAAARNYAATLAPEDWVAMPDCDEIYTGLDIDKINGRIQAGVDQFEYNFIFAHDAEGKPALQFRHCKFYNRVNLTWTGVIHEVLAPTGAKKEPTREYVDYIKLEHWQNPSTNRGQYLTGLAVDRHMNPNNDRNAHYFARELLYSGRPLSARRALLKHISMNAWPAEQAQSMIYMGDTYEDDEQKKLGWYFRAWTTDPGRREAVMRIAEHYYKAKKPLQTATFATAALEIPLNDYYGNRMEHYTWYPHEMLYWAKWQLGNEVSSGYHWGMARKHAPLNSKFLHDARFYNKLPKVSIVIPHVPYTRQESLDKCVRLIHANCNYPPDALEVIVQEDPRPCEGCPKTFNKGVEKATGDLIMFLGDDCEPQPDFLIQAVLSHLQFKWNTKEDTALTALNDGMWEGTLATHWLADKNFVWRLPRGEFLVEEYNHVGCDNELTAWAKTFRVYNYCRDARIVHVTPVDEVSSAAWDKDRVAQDRALLFKRCTTYGLNPKDALCDEPPATVPAGNPSGAGVCDTTHAQVGEV